MGKMTATKSHLFTLRVWGEDVGNGRFEFRGTLKHVLTNETHHFRDWPTLLRYLEARLQLHQACIASHKSEGENNET